MDQEVEIIRSETRKEKIKNFFINNKKKIISIVICFFLILFSFFFYQEYEEKNKERLANRYNAAIIEYESGEYQHPSKFIKAQSWVCNVQPNGLNPAVNCPVYIFLLIVNKNDGLK